MPSLSPVRYFGVDDMLAGSDMNEAAAFNSLEKKGTGFRGHENWVGYRIGVGGAESEGQRNKVESS
jgi:hypothetical protein